MGKISQRQLFKRLTPDEVLEVKNGIAETVNEQLEKTGLLLIDDDFTGTLICNDLKTIDGKNIWLLVAEYLVKADRQENMVIKLTQAYIYDNPK